MLFLLTAPAALSVAILANCFTFASLPLGVGVAAFCFRFPALGTSFRHALSALTHLVRFFPLALAEEAHLAAPTANVASLFLATFQAGAATYHPLPSRWWKVSLGLLLLASETLAQTCSDGAARTQKTVQGSLTLLEST